MHNNSGFLIIEALYAVCIFSFFALIIISSVLKVKNMQHDSLHRMKALSVVRNIVEKARAENNMTIKTYQHDTGTVSLHPAAVSEKQLCDDSATLSLPWIHVVMRWNSKDKKNITLTTLCLGKKETE